MPHTAASFGPASEIADSGSLGFGFGMAMVGRSS